MSGGRRSTNHDQVAAGPGTSVLPTLSMPRTSNVCTPWARPEKSPQLAVPVPHGPPSMRHWTWARPEASGGGPPDGGSDELWVNEALVLCVANVGVFWLFGVSPRSWSLPGSVPVSVLAGGVMSIAHRYVVLVPTLPALSVTCTVSVWWSSASPDRFSGEAQAVNAPPSSEHLVEKIPELGLGSCGLNVNVALCDAVYGWVGPLSIVGAGGCVSMKNERSLIGPATSPLLPWTCSVWAPSERELNVSPDEHAAPA